jgi:hypothetical protein
MLKIESDLTGLLKVVGASAVESLTLEGWKLVFTYQDTALAPCQESEPSPPQTGSSYFTPAVGVVRFRPHTVTMFIMQLDEQSALAQTHKELEIVKKAYESEARMLEQSREEAKVQRSKVTEAKEAVSEYSRKNISLASQLDTARKSNQKLELDIAKIRTAVGELKLKEILA